jgi:hypothetical protein
VPAGDELRAFLARMLGWSNERAVDLPAPLVVPPLAQRSAELDRIIAEYASDAIEELAAPASSLTAADHAWVRAHAAASLAEIEKATLRLVALRTSRNLSGRFRCSSC